MILAEHYYQRVDLEGNCCIEATRDDTDDIQDCHYSVWKNGRKIHDGWLIYNIQYDYIRHREWWYGKLYYDYLESDNTYGHLAEEFSYLPPEEKRYPNDWEPVTPRGSDYFHEEGITAVTPRLLECNVWFSVHFYIRKDITNPNKLNPPMNLIDVEPLTSDDRICVEEAKKKWKEWGKKREKEPQKWREERKKWRLKFLREHSEYIGVFPIPYDSRFID